MKTKNELLNEIEITVTAHESNIPVRGNAIVSGDNIFDRQVENKILEELEYNEWAWCDITVMASIRGIRGYAYLGACSYKSKEDFINANDYYTDLVSEATDDLLATLEAVQYSKEVA